MITTSRQLKDLILKGGMLVAAMVGLDARSTMDLDATVKGTNINVEDVGNMISSILSVPVEDGVTFRVKKISEIMEEAEYPGVRVSMETVLAEKLETIISRNITNTRMRDFYDIHILKQLYEETLSTSMLRDALAATANKRGTLQQIQDAGAVFDEIEESPIMEKLWQSYQKNYPYAANLPWHTFMDSVRDLYRIVYESHFVNEISTF